MSRQRGSSHRAAATVAAALVALIWLPTGAVASTNDDCGIMQIYDRLLPLSVENTEHHGASEIVVLRYIPGDTTVEREFEITIVQKDNGIISAQRTEGKDKSIYAQVREAWDSGVTVCEEVVARVKTTRREYTDQTDLRRLLGDLHRLRVPQKLESATYLDAPRYDILVTAKMNSESFALYGPTAQSKHPHPLIRWFLEVAKALPGQAGGR